MEMSVNIHLKFLVSGNSILLFHVMIAWRGLLRTYTGSLGCGTESSDTDEPPAKMDCQGSSHGHGTSCSRGSSRSRGSSHS